MLTGAEVAGFVEDGFVVIREAVPDQVVARCAAEVDELLRAEGVDPTDPATWTRPVVRLACPWTPAFADAGTRPVLHEAYDQLLGPGTWVPAPGVGGTIPVRFPHPDDPGDAGWHVDGSWAGPDGRYWLDVHSRDRGLLCLFLLTDVGPDDAPTELLPGSHANTARALEPFGADGTDFVTLAGSLPASTFERPTVRATGRAGDVVVCHPFLVHRATWPHRGRRPRAIAQPAIPLRQPLALTAPAVDPEVSPVERAILAALGR